MAAYVTIIQGSPRRRGNTESAVRRLVEHLDGGTEVSLVTLAELRVSRCIGCRRCISEGICAIADDDFPRLWGAIRLTDVIVQACPVYWHSPPGLMKDFIDRTHSTYPDRGYLRGKRAYHLVVAADSGFETCETIMGSWITSYGGKVSGTARLLARDLGELEARPENLRRIEEMAGEILALCAKERQEGPGAKTSSV